MPDLLRLAGILALIILLLRLRLDLGLVLLIASIVTAVLYGLSLGDFALTSIGATVEALTLRLIAIVLLITLLGEMLGASLQLEGLIRSLTYLFEDRRWLLALIPMLIGLLPMVGGAMFSAPMVQEASEGLNLSGGRRTYINYWFRHVWETIFPLYPSLILAAGLMGVTAQTLTMTQWPLFLATLIGGILFGIVGIKRAPENRAERPDGESGLVLLAKSIWPIVLVLLLSILLGVDLILALLITVGILSILERLGPGQLFTLVKRMPLGTVPIIVGTMIFRRVLETSGAIEVTSQAFASLGIPLPLIVFSIPMVAGLLTGLAVAAFAIGFPIVFPLVGPDLMASGYGLLAYTGAFVGLMLSPVHLCLALTREYFDAEWGDIYRRTVPGSLLVILAAVLALLVKG
ncbi:DUF401 family protein [Chloroflexota bacterium]